MSKKTDIFLRKIKKVAGELEKRNWHSITIEETFSRLSSGTDGLSSTEAFKRLETFGRNELPEKEGESPIKLFFSQFNSPLMYIMIGAFFVSVFLNHKSESIFIAIVMISNVLVGFYQEYKANSSISSLKNMIKLKARVIRGGLPQEIYASEVVPGDVVVLRSGDKIVADCRLIESNNLKVNESNLTGESKSVDKSVGNLPLETGVSDKSNMVFMGTVVDDGTAHALVVETGTLTEYGDIVELLQETPEESTPLQKTMFSLSKIIGLIVSVFIGIIFLEGYLIGRPVAEMFTTSLALFVSAIPEGLLPAVTIVLAIGMRRILNHKGLVRRLASTETLGGVTVICTDKTGTLTEGKMLVSKILTVQGEFDVPSHPNQNSAITDLPKAVLQASIFTNDAFIENPNDSFSNLVIRGRATEKALLKAGFLFGLNKNELDKEFKTKDTIFFSSERKFSASLREDKNQKDVLFVLGAPERILEKISFISGASGEVLDLKDEKAIALLKNLEDLINRGYRVVAAARKDFDTKINKIGEGDVNNLTLLGFAAISDPVRPDVAEAFNQTKTAGIKTVIITGDHKATAIGVAKKIGIDLSPENILEGKDIESMDDDTLNERIGEVLLYARVSPRHKLRIVQAFQRRGEVVAMFGDGVNDAPALKIADIGVAVSSEVDAVREVADLVLLDSGFKTVVRAIEQGRVIFRNIRRVFLYLIVQDFSQFFLFLVAIALGLPLPMIAVQLFFANLVESGLPDIALTTEDDRDGVMEEPPRSPKESVLNKPSLRWMISIFVISGVTATIFYLVTLSLTGDLDKTRTMVMLLMCFESLFLAYSVRSFRRPVLRKDIFENRWLNWAVIISIIMVAGAIYFEPLANILSTVRLSFFEVMFTLLINIIRIFFIDEFKVKFFNAPK